MITRSGYMQTAPIAPVNVMVLRMSVEYWPGLGVDAERYNLRRALYERTAAV